MNYTKPAVSIADQILKLKERGLLISDEKKATSYLGNISYYRLRAYIPILFKIIITQPIRLSKKYVLKTLSTWMLAKIACGVWKLNG